ELLTRVASQHGQSASSNTPVSGVASEARDQNRGNTHATPRSTSVHQLDLFGLPDLAGFDQPSPLWGVLPEETRQLVTELMVPLLLDHGRVAHRPVRTEAADDV